MDIFNPPKEIEDKLLKMPTVALVYILKNLMYDHPEYIIDDYTELVLVFLLKWHRTNTLNANQLNVLHKHYLSNYTLITTQEPNIHLKHEHIDYLTKESKNHH